MNNVLRLSASHAFSADSAEFHRRTYLLLPANDAEAASECASLALVHYRLCGPREGACAGADAQARRRQEKAEDLPLSDADDSLAALDDIINYSMEDDASLLDARVVPNAVDTMRGIALERAELRRATPQSRLTAFAPKTLVASEMTTDLLLCLDSAISARVVFSNGNAEVLSCVASMVTPMTALVELPRSLCRAAINNGDAFLHFSVKVRLEGDDQESVPID